MSGELPVGWVLTTIQDVLHRLEYGYTAKAEHRDEGPRFLRITDIENGLINWTSVPRCEIDQRRLPQYRLQHGDIVFARTGSIDKACIVRNPPEAVFASYLIRGRPVEALTALWLDAFVASFHYRTQAAAASAGIGRANINAKSIGRIELRLAPLPEQRRIVDAIESYFTRLDDAVATLERVQRNLKRYRASVLKAAVEGRLVPTEAELARAEGRSYEPASVLLERILAERRRRWEEAELAKMKAKGKAPKDDKWKAKYVEPSAPDTTGLPELPEGWAWATVAALASKVVDGVHKKPSYVEAGVPFITVKNLTAGPGISFERLRYITQEDHEKFIVRANPERGDILVSKDGTLGVVRAIRTDRVFSIFVSVALVKPVLLEMSDYLEIALSSPVVQSQMTPKGSGLQHIHLEDLRADCVPVPPQREWTRICAEVQRHFSMIDELDREVARNRIRCSRLRQSILKWAFEGRLVDQDPSDELASVLLARIRAERQAAHAVTSAPRRPRTSQRGSALRIL